MSAILDVQKISKKFMIRHRSAGYHSLRERLMHIFERETGTEEFHALKDVSFQVREGESLGIIGRNGAGKSTLLKILSRITPPTRGRFVARGRIASLLEVGTGFHPELTGRENIFFNGSLLGMKKTEIEDNFDEIVDFSGIERFLDTPLKHYSSGMQLRLAFSVAAFLQPEILVVDEVLAVGDAEFQKKCMGKMDDVSRSGRTILLVSHNMAAVQRLCPRGIVLRNGMIDFEGRSSEAVTHYLSGLADPAAPEESSFVPEDCSIIQKIEVFCDGRMSASLYMGCEAQIRVYFKSEQPLEFPVLGVIFRDRQNVPLLAVNNKHYQKNLARTAVGTGMISLTIPYLTLFAGNYAVDIHFGNGFEDIVVLRDFVQLTVDAMSFTAHGEMPDDEYNKFFIPKINWSLEHL